MTPHKFIPPRDDETDWNPAIEQQIEDMLFSYKEEEIDIRDSYEPEDEVDDLRNINIG